MANQTTINEPEEIEGIGSPEDPKDLDDATLEEYPLDTMMIRNENRTVHDVLRRIDGGTYIMDPDFQRDFIWPDDKQSKLIESVLMRIPLPVFYVAEEQDGRLVVVDGLQRLSTFRRFVNDELRLRLPKRPELNTKRFSDLSPKFKNRVEDFNLILYILDAKAPERTRLDIFERVNSGVALSRQQMRNCLYMGKATRFLREEAATEFFKKATDGSIRSEQMRDREFINRFCGFQIMRSSYNGDMDAFLARTLTHMNQMDDTQLQNLSTELRTGLSNNYNVFGRQAFRKYQNGNVRRNIINASIWDVMMAGLAKRSEHEVDAHANQLRESFQRLLADETFDDAITYGTNQKRRVNRRFTKAGKMFREVFGD